ncbi:MAG: hypothetical protein Q8P97_00400 [bacterium]|nr:hypothetical protein [bacterium]
MGREKFGELSPPEKLSSRKAEEGKESSHGDMRDLTEEERLALRRRLNEALRSKKKRQ